jgi:hypothetical protein
MSTITLIAIIVPLIWVGWLILTEWVPMFPLNDLEASTVRERATTAALNYTVGLVIAGGILIDQTWSLVVAVVVSLLALAGHIASWWLPYFGISTQAQRDAYQREFARTWKVLPTEGHDVVIDVQHMAVGVITVIMVGTTLAAALA